MCLDKIQPMGMSEMSTSHNATYIPLPQVKDGHIGCFLSNVVSSAVCIIEMQVVGIAAAANMSSPADQNTGQSNLIFVLYKKGEDWWPTNSHLFRWELDEKFDCK